MDNSITGSRVLLISPFFLPELISTGKYNTVLVKRLVDAGCKLDVVCSHPLYPDWIATYSNAQLPGVTIHRGGLKVKYPSSAVLRRLVLEFWFLWFVLLKVIRLRKKIDIVISVFPPNLYFSVINSLLPRRVKRVALVHDIQGIMAVSTKNILRKSVSFFTGKIEKIVFNMCDQVICLSDSMGRYVRRTYDVLEEKCDIHYPFVTLDQVDHGKDELADLFPPAYKHIVYSGALGEKQKPDLLFELFESIPALEPDIMCHIFSGGPKYLELKHLARKMAVHNVCFHKLVPDSQVAHLYLHSDVQIIPQAEGISAGAFPSKLPNLIAMGVPVFVICDENSEVSLLFKGLDTAFLAHTWETRELQEKLVSFLRSSNRKSFLERVQENRGLIEQRFNIENLVQSILKVKK